MGTPSKKKKKNKIIKNGKSQKDEEARILCPWRLSFSQFNVLMSTPNCEKDIFFIFKTISHIGSVSFKTYSVYSTEFKFTHTIEKSQVDGAPLRDAEGPGNRDDLTATAADSDPDYAR